MQHELSIAFQTDKPLAEYARLGQAAERLGQFLRRTPGQILQLVLEAAGVAQAG